jgi:hypothetical protein
MKMLFILTKSLNQWIEIPATGRILWWEERNKCRHVPKLNRLLILWKDSNLRAKRWRVPIRIYIGRQGTKRRRFLSGIHVTDAWVKEGMSLEESSCWTCPFKNPSERHMGLKKLERKSIPLRIHVTDAWLKKGVFNVPCDRRCWGWKKECPFKNPCDGRLAKKGCFQCSL